MDGDPPNSAPAPTVLDIRGGRGRARLVLLSDGRELVVSDEACERAGLRRDEPFDEEAFASLELAEQRVNAHEAALRLLSHRSRSEAEMRQRLRMRGIEDGIIEEEVERLRTSGLIDDEKFAKAWVEDRRRMAPRGRRMLRYELLGKGIDPGAVDEATGTIDDEATAMELARSRARGPALQSYEEFMTRVGGFLRRRGFSYDVVATAARQVWAEVSVPGDAPHSL